VIDSARAALAAGKLHPARVHRPHAPRQHTIIAMYLISLPVLDAVCGAALDLAASCCIVSSQTTRTSHRGSSSPCDMVPAIVILRRQTTVLGPWTPFTSSTHADLKTFRRTRYASPRMAVIALAFQDGLRVRYEPACAARPSLTSRGVQGCGCFAARGGWFAASVHGASVGVWLADAAMLPGGDSPAAGAPYTPGACATRRCCCCCCCRCCCG
jgi:hypothetical protein